MVWLCQHSTLTLEYPNPAWLARTVCKRSHSSMYAKDILTAAYERKESLAPLSHSLSLSHAVEGELLNGIGLRHGKLAAAVWGFSGTELVPCTNGAGQHFLWWFDFRVCLLHCLRVFCLEFSLDLFAFVSRILSLDLRIHSELCFSACFYNFSSFFFACFCHYANCCTFAINCPRRCSTRL